MIIRLGVRIAAGEKEGGGGAYLKRLTDCEIVCVVPHPQPQATRTPSSTPTAKTERLWDCMVLFSPFPPPPPPTSISLFPVRLSGAVFSPQPPPRPLSLFLVRLHGAVFSPAPPPTPPPPHLFPPRLRDCEIANVVFSPCEIANVVFSPCEIANVSPCEIANVVFPLWDCKCCFLPLWWKCCFSPWTHPHHPPPSCTPPSEDCSEHKHCCLIQDWHG